MARRTRLIVLAAGQGQRLRPLTDDRPKALVTVGRRALLDWTLDTARTCGLTQVTVVGGYRPQGLRDRDVEVVLNEDYASTNMVETLWRARHRWGRDCVVCYGDILFEVCVLERLLACSAPVAVVVDLAWESYWRERFEDPLEDAETLRLTPEGRILEIGKKPRALEDIQGQYIGLVRFQGEGIRALEAAYAAAQRENLGGRTCLGSGRSLASLHMTDLLQGLIDQGQWVQAVPIRGRWLEIDGPEDLRLAETYFCEGRIDRPITGEEGT